MTSYFYIWVKLGNMFKKESATGNHHHRKDFPKLTYKKKRKKKDMKN